MKARTTTRFGQKLQNSYEKAQQNLLMIVGSPKTVTEKIKSILQVLRPGVFTLFQVQGPVGNTDRLNSMRLFAKEVAPPIREFAKQIELTNPFERFPGSVKLTPERKAVASSRPHAVEIAEDRCQCDWGLTKPLLLGRRSDAPTNFPPLSFSQTKSWTSACKISDASFILLPRTVEGKLVLHVAKGGIDYATWESD